MAEISRHSAINHNNESKQGDTHILHPRSRLVKEKHLEHSRSVSEADSFKNVSVHNIHDCEYKSVCIY